MERNSAARAMEWSMELEKGLRSKIAGRSAETILKFGPRLRRWSREPQPTPAAYHLFDLIPGEDRLFANAILLRLADAFRLGDQHNKLCVVKVFLMEYRHRDKVKGKGYRGLLSKARVSNQLELLTRAKLVFDNGDAISKALALVLFGCWADFANDSSHVRYLVLSSMVSSHVLEARAALFAAGCFCELSDDFPCIVLEMLVNIVALPETLAPIRLAAARVFAKMEYSSSTATTAYKTGIKLALESSEEDYQVAFLVSLSKIAATSTTLVSDQVDFLFSFLSKEKTLRVRATALKCLLFIFSKGVSHFSVSAKLIKSIFSMLDEPELPLSMQCEALRILRKMLLYLLPSLPGDICDLGKLSIVAENAFRSHIMSKGMLAIRVVVEVSNKFEGNRYVGSLIPSHLVSLIVNQITFLVKPLFDIDHSDSVVFQEVNNLLSLLLSIVREHLDLADVVLDQIFVFIRYLSSMNNNAMATAQMDMLDHEKADTKGENGGVIRLKIACNVYRFMVTCLENLREAGAITMPVFDKVKLLVEHVCECNLFDCYTHTIYSLLLHSPVIWRHSMNRSEESCNLDGSSGILIHNYLVEHELITLKFAKRIVAENRYWHAYKVGRNSACQGAWFTSTFIFHRLIMQVRSDSCFRWLKSLFQFVQSERKVMLLLLTRQDSSLTGQSKKIKLPLMHVSNDLDEIRLDGMDHFYQPNYRKVLLSAYESICSSKDTLEVDSTSGQSFCFQRWFLSLRAKTLRAVVDVLDILETIPLVSENDCSTRQVDKSSMVEYLPSLEQIAQVSLRLKRLGKEFDLFSTSFMDMDNTSSKIISALALSCSLLALITGFSLFIQKLPNTCLENSKNNLRAHLIQNLAGRLWHIDHEMSTKLCRLINVSELPSINCFHLQSRNQAFNFGCEARDVLDLCGYAVSEIACLRSEVDMTLNDEHTSKVNKNSLQLTLEILMKWMQIPLRTPKYFFRLRPCIGSELFAASVTKCPDGILVSPGYHLSLSLCLQLRNVPPDRPVRLTKLYCMLYCGVSFQEPRPVQESEEQCRNSYQAWETDNMVEMNEMLLHYVMQCGTKSVKNIKCGSGVNDCGFAKTFVCFEPDERDQGFSSCLLDVSRFPVGSYRIKWHSCCIDKQGNYWSLLPLNAGPVFTIQ